MLPLSRTGFFGPDSWNMSHEHNGRYGSGAVNDGKLAVPVLFLHAA